MSVKIVPNPSVEGIHVSHMEDGQLGELIDKKGEVVQMLRAAYGISRDTLLIVGGTPGDSWSAPLPNFMVRILQPGDKIEVTAN